MRLHQNHIVMIGVFVLLGFVSAGTVGAQTFDNLSVYVWDFAPLYFQGIELSEREVREVELLTEQLTEEFEDALANIGDCFQKVVDRRTIGTLLEQRDQEQMILSIEGISPQNIETLKMKEANAIIFGDVNKDPSGKTKVTVRVLTFDSVQLARERVWLSYEETHDPIERASRMKDLVEMLCPSSVPSSTPFPDPPPPDGEPLSEPTATPTLTPSPTSIPVPPTEMPIVTNETFVNDDSEGKSPDFSTLVVRYDDKLVHITIVVSDDPAESNMYMYGTYADMIALDPIDPGSFELRRDYGEDGHFEDLIYTGSTKRRGSSISIVIPIKYLPDISTKKIWLYSMKSQDRIPDEGELLFPTSSQ